jgi:outer membrane receptor protein involved in Fe transport
MTLKNGWIRTLRALTAIAFGMVSLNAQVPPRINGTVRDVNLAVISNASVACAKSPTKVQTKSDSNGRFSVDPTTCGSAALLVSAKGFDPITIPFGQPQKDDLDIVLQPSTIGAVVTVSGIETAIPDSPESILAVTRDDLVNPGSAALDEGLRQIPGYTLFRRTSSRTANPTSQGVSLRGVGGSGASRAVVLIDGIPLNDPFGGWVYWGRIPFESIDQVEVLRGPGSDQYGSSAIGGVISIRPRAPLAGIFSSLDAFYGSMRTPAFSSYSSAGSHRVIGSLAGEFFRTDGYIPTAAESRGFIDRAANVRRIALRPRLDVNFTGGHGFVGGEFYQEVRENGTVLQSNDTRLRAFSLGFDQDPKKFGSVAIRMFGLSQEYHQSFSTITADRNSESLSRLQRVPSNAFGANAKWTKEFDRHVIFGRVEYRRRSGLSDETGFNGGVPTSRTETGGDQTTFAAAIGGRSTFGRFTLNGSLRFDRSLNSDGHSIVRSLMGTTLSSTQFASRSDTSLNGRASVLVRVTDNINVSAAYATGFREPTLNELYRGFRLGNVLTLPNENLRSERARNLEAAVTFTGLSNRLYLRTGAYCISISQAISNVTLSVTPSLITRRRGNLDSSRTCGIEADGKFRVKASLWLAADYLFVNSIVSASGGNPQVVGLRLPQVARHQFSMQASWVSSRWGTARLQMRASSSQYDDDLNAFALSGYTVIGATYSRPLGPNVDVYGGIENAFGTRIEAGRTPILSLGQPRTARIGVRLRFGRQR